MIPDQLILDRVFQPITNFLARRGFELEACARQLTFVIAAAETAFAAEDALTRPSPWRIAANVFFGAINVTYFFSNVENCRPRSAVNANVFHFWMIRLVFLTSLVASLPWISLSFGDGLWTLLQLTLWVSFSLASTSAVPPTRRRAAAPRLGLPQS